MVLKSTSRQQPRTGAFMSSGCSPRFSHFASSTTSARGRASYRITSVGTSARACSCRSGAPPRFSHPRLCGCPHRARPQSVRGPGRLKASPNPPPRQSSLHGTPDTPPPPPSAHPPESPRARNRSAPGRSASSSVRITRARPVDLTQDDCAATLRLALERWTTRPRQVGRHRRGRFNAGRAARRDVAVIEVRMRSRANPPGRRAQPQRIMRHAKEGSCTS